MIDVHPSLTVSQLISCDSCRIRKFSTKAIIVSFPAGADSAIISVIAAKALPSTSRGVIVAQYTVAVQEIHEQCGGTTFIAVGERVILDNLIQQVRGFLLGGTVQFFASERLVESCDDSLERTVAFPPEQIGLRVERHRPDEQHRVLIGQDPLGLVALGYRDIACVIVVKQHKTRQISFQDLCGASNFRFGGPR